MFKNKSVIKLFVFFMLIIISFGCSNAATSNEETGFINTDKLYKVTIEGQLQYLVENILTEYEAGSSICIKTYVTDDNIMVYVNDIIIEKSAEINDSNYYYYFFEMPEEDVTVKIVVDDLEWENEEAVYVFIKNEYRNEVFIDIEENFSNYNYKKIYVTNKQIYENGDIYYKLLFVINSNMSDFCNMLRLDERIESFEICKDLPYESYDNRYIYCEKSVINVGDTTTLLLKGDCDIYRQCFRYDSFYLKPVDYKMNKKYDISDFPEIDGIQQIENQIDGLLIWLDESNYYELIKTIDILARRYTVQYIDLNYIYIMHPIWEISDEDIVEYSLNSDFSITLKALKPGVVNLRFDGMDYNIIVNDNRKEE